MLLAQYFTNSYIFNGLKYSGGPYTFITANITYYVLL